MIELFVDFCVPGEQGRDAVETVSEYVEAYNAHDLSRVRGIFIRDARIGNGDSPLTGEQLLTNYETIVFPRFPGARITLEERLAAGDMVAQTETVTGVYEPETGLSVYRVDRGCIIEMSINR